MTQRHVMFAAIAVLCIAILFVTILPIQYRPSTGHDECERFLAFAVLGGLLSAAVPGRPWLSAILVATIAAALEALQLIVPGRHGELSTACLKAFSGIAGMLIFQFALSFVKGNDNDGGKRQLLTGFALSGVCSMLLVLRQYH